MGFILGIGIGIFLAKVLTVGAEDLWIVVGAVLGTLIGVGYIKWRDKKKAYSKFLPHIVGKEN